jgi:hypothetical protein
MNECCKKLLDKFTKKLLARASCNNFVRIVEATREEMKDD